MRLLHLWEHKIFAPTGIGALYGRSDLLDRMSPCQGGGSMIKDVTFTKTIYTNLPRSLRPELEALLMRLGLAQRLIILMSLIFKRQVYTRQHYLRWLLTHF